jgi:hypothetical protein
MAFTMTGRNGSLRVGGRPALTLDWFTFSVRDPSMGGGWLVEGRVAAKDAYWLERAAAYDLRLDLSRSVWRWRDVPAASVVLDGEKVTISHQGEPEDV